MSGRSGEAGDEREGDEGLPTPDARHGEPEPTTVEELAVDLARTEVEQAALDALFDDPDGQSLEMLKQHLRHAEGSAADEGSI